MNLIVKERSKFSDPATTADGKARASVGIRRLTTLWFNTGTLCNLTCRHCYIESSPKNDRLSYLTSAEVKGYLEEIQSQGLPVEEIGFTGGEPFMNPDLMDMVEDALQRDFRVLILTNAMRPMMKCADALLQLREQYPEQLALRVSVDHFAPGRHREERGNRSWRPTIAGLQWLAQQGFVTHVAGRTLWGDSEEELRTGFANLFAELDIDIDATDPATLVIFPEMDDGVDVPEITTECWSLLGKNPHDLMCASSRMIVKRKGRDAPEVVSCTLLPYDEDFSLGRTLTESLGEVPLNHPHCAKFCVLGGGSCSA